MVQQRFNRTTCGLLATTAVIAAMGTATLNATAEPPAPTNEAQALKQYKDLAQQAEKVQQSLLKAKDDLHARQQDLNKAKGDAAKAGQDEQAAKTQENQFRGQVDQLSNATLQGAQFSKLSALMAGGSAQDYLDRASALKVISSQNDSVMNQMTGATNRASSARAAAGNAQQRAQNATNSANQLIVDIQNRSKSVQQQISTVKAALQKLGGAARSALGGSGDDGVYVGSGVGGKAMEIALGQRGVPYVWGGTTPSGFDCSGLTSYSFGKAGVSLPRSSQAQSTTGEAISRDALQPGDLVFFGSPVHHVGIYVGDGKMVNAPNFGENVQVEPLQSDYSGARRVG